jgi:hypothetical protein
MVLYFSTLNLCVQRIVVILSMRKSISWICKKHGEKSFWISFVVGFLSQMMLRNCKYFGYVAWHIDMDKKCSCGVFQ